MADPLPVLLAEHTWPEVQDGPGTTHRLVPIGGRFGAELLDWVEETGRFSVWVPSGSISGGSFAPYDPAPRSTGVLPGIGPGHRLFCLFDEPGSHNEGNVLDLNVATNEVRIFRLHRDDTTGHPLRTVLNRSRFSTITLGHQLIYLGGDRVLDWEPDFGRLRVWRYDRTRTTTDPLPTKVTESQWDSFVGDQLVYLGGDLLLDWAPSGTVVVWRYDRSVAGDDADPFPIEEMRDDWADDIPFDHELHYIGEDRVLERDPATGFVRIWDFDRPMMPSGAFDILLAADIATAQGWIGTTLAALAAHQRGIVTGQLDARWHQIDAILRIHFRVQAHPSGSLAAVAMLQANYTRALSRLTLGVGVFSQVSRAQALEESALPGFPDVQNYRPGHIVPGVAIHLTPGYRPFESLGSVGGEGLGDRTRASLLLRLALHFELGDVDVQADETFDAYDTMIPEATVNNRAAYAVCAHHLTTGEDVRFLKTPWR